jgi:hypothetical protein
MKILKSLSNAVDPNYWAERIGTMRIKDSQSFKTGAYDKAHNSKLAQWTRSLTGWRWWAWQLGPCVLLFILIEKGLNMIHMTMLPW